MAKDAGRNSEEQEVVFDYSHRLGIRVEIIGVIILEVAVLGECLRILQHTAQHSLAVDLEELDQLLGG